MIVYIMYNHRTNSEKVVLGIGETSVLLYHYTLCSLHKICVFKVQLEAQ